MSRAAAGALGVLATGMVRPVAAAATVLAPTLPDWFDVRDYGAVATRLEGAQPYNTTFSAPPPDSTAAFKAATDAAGAAGGGIVYVPAGYYLGRFEARSRVIVQGDGMATWVKAPPPASNAGNLPLWGSTDDAWHCGIRDIVLEGNRVADAYGNPTSGAAERGISVTSPNGDAYEESLSGADAGTGAGPHRPLLLIDNVAVRDSGGDGCYLGVNYRAARARRLVVRGAGGNGLVVACSDSRFTDCSVSRSYGLANVVCLGSGNMLTQVRAALTGDGMAGVTDPGGVYSCGFLVYGVGTVLDNCRSEDHAGPAMTIGADPATTGFTGGPMEPGRRASMTYLDFSPNGGSVKTTNLLCAGNAGGVYVRGGYGNHDIDAAFTSGSVGLLSPYALSLMGAATVNPIALRLRAEWSIDGSGTPGVDQSSWRFLVDAGPDPDLPSSGPPDMNAVSLEVVGAQRARAVTMAAGDTLVPDIVLGLDHVVTLTGDGEVAALVDRSGCAAGAWVRFVLVQDGVGGHTVSWDATWAGAPQPAGAPGSVTGVAFVNTSSDPASPAWQLWAPVAP